MKEWITLLSSAAVGILAFLSSRLLSRWIGREKDTSSEVKFASGVVRDAKISAEGVLAVFNALEILSQTITAESRMRLQQLTVELETLQARFPLSGRYAITLGRVYRALGDLQKANEVLLRFITSKQMNGELDGDLGDAYYNLACYLALEGKSQLAVENLKHAIQLNPANLQLAQIDSDLSSIREEISGILKGVGREDGPSEISDYS